MIVKIKLLQDTIFGSGMSVPGGEDSSVNYDKDGYPYLKGSTFRGVFREEFENYLYWTGKDSAEKQSIIADIFGNGGYELENRRKIYISDFMIPKEIREEIKEEYILDALTNLRVFTSLENGVAKSGSLRTIRCINKGLAFYGEIECEEEDRDLIKEVLSYVKWLGSMRTRGFGKVKVEVLK